MQGSANILELPKDVLRTIILGYLDGPSACYLVQTCTRFASLLTFRERLQVRTRAASLKTLRALARGRLRAWEELSMALAERRYARQRRELQESFQYRLATLSVCSVCGRSNYDAERCCCAGNARKRQTYSTIIECACGEVGTLRMLRPWRVTKDEENFLHI